jgi:hypothetical protein
MDWLFSRRIFHWKYSSIVIPASWPFGWGMVALATVSFVPPALFYMAYVIFVFALLWSEGAWLSSRYLEKANPRNWNRKRRKLSDLKASNLKYEVSRWGVVVIIVFFFAMCMYYAGVIQTGKELADLHGILIAANDSDPSPRCKTNNSEEVKINLGNTVVIAEHFPFAAISVEENGDDETRIPLITLERDSHGRLIVTSDVVGQDGKLIARISENDFSVDEASIFRTYKERPDKSTLVLTDHYGNRMLYVRFLNQTSVKILGTLYFPKKLSVATGAGVSIDDKNGVETIDINPPMQFGNDCVENTMKGGILVDVYPERR